MPLRHTYFTPGIVAALLCSLCSVPSVRGQERLTSTASNSPLQTEFENRSLRPGTDMRDAYLRNPALIHRMVGERRYFFGRKSRVRQREARYDLHRCGRGFRTTGRGLSALRGAGVPRFFLSGRTDTSRATGRRSSPGSDLRQEETTTSVGAHCAIPDCTGLTLLPIRRAATSVMKSTI